MALYKCCIICMSIRVHVFLVVTACTGIRRCRSSRRSRLSLRSRRFYTRFTTSTRTTWSLPTSAQTGSVHIRKYSGLRGQLSSGFSAHLPRCALRGHLLGGTQGHCLRGQYGHFHGGHIGHLGLAFWPLFSERITAVNETF